MSSARSGSPQPSPCVDLSRGSPSLQWGLFRKSTGPHPGNPVHRIALWKFTVSKDKLIISTPQLVIKSFVRAGTEASKVLWKTLPARKPSSILPRGHTPNKGRAVRPGTKQMGNPKNVVGWAHGRILNILRVPPPRPISDQSDQICTLFQTRNVWKWYPSGWHVPIWLIYGTPPPPPPPSSPAGRRNQRESRSHRVMWLSQLYLGASCPMGKYSRENCPWSGCGTRNVANVLLLLCCLFIWN